ncbi:hypothetical protein [Usitatibacter palustris]|uniref:Uncharacterized protein n=1 Tax=Usitatibacter palustris TaxID=2732487 RepID=A0A6M4H6H0_9PROT|nr:hypothetical protein [Usitatibacter palustris]QJR14942.1 hypothetical protein DSM104440_01757 [Usitatibacter palustris]
MKAFFDGDRPSWPLRLGAAAIWLVMVWDLFDRVRDNAPWSSIVTSIGLVTFVTLAVLLPFSFGAIRPEPGTPSRWAWDGVVITSALFALGGLLVRTLG